MKVLIIEDEYHAQKRLEKILKALRPKIEIQAKIDSVEQAVKWLISKPKPDLIFLDIQLSDGLSFEIFTKIQVETPVIFSTAFDEFAIKAFKLNSVDYLLKPVEEEELEQALIKFETHFKQRVSYEMETIQRLVSSLIMPSYKSRFLIKKGQNFTYIPIEEIAYFFSEDSFSFLKTHSGQKQILDQTLDQLTELVNPKDFFRINRKALVKIDAVKKVSPYFNSRLLLHLQPQPDFDAIVSRDRVPDFKLWLGK